jgi:hypothetical protein
MYKIKLYIFLLIGFSFFHNIILAQAPNIEWQKCLGGTFTEIPYCIQQTSDGGYILIGFTRSNDGDVSGHHDIETRDIWVVKLNNVGAIEWQKCLGGSSNDNGYFIIETTDHGYILVGETESNDGNVTGNHSALKDMWIVKLSNSGNIVWQKCLGGFASDGAYCIQQTSDGGYIIAGYTFSNEGDVLGNHGLIDWWVVKLNNSGTLEWQKCLGGSSSEMAYSIQQTTDSGYILTGSTNSNDVDVSGNHGNSDIWVVKLSNTGNIEWQKCLGGSNSEEARSIQQTNDGGYIITGDTRSNDGDVTGNHGFSDMWVVKLNISGNIEWQRCLGGTFGDSGNSILQTADGGYMVAGIASSNDGDISGYYGYMDSWIVKLNYLGIIEWQKCYGGTSTEQTKLIKQTSDGGYIVTAVTESHDGDVSGNHYGGDMWVLKLGNTVSLENVSSSSISFYPNPVLNELVIEIDNKFLGSTFNIYNSLGQVSFYGKIEQNKMSVNLSLLPTGIYNLSVMNNGGYSFKFIKN